MNPAYDPNEVYIPRKDRKEWDPVGFAGKLVLIDDGTCVVGSKCSCGVGGIATAGTDFRVIKRLDETHILIFM